MPNIEGIGEVLRDAARRGVVDSAQAEEAVERWKRAEKALDEAVSRPMPEREAKVKEALDEYNASTREVSGLYGQAT